MLTLRMILQQICQFFRGLTIKVTKRMYRSSAVFMAGAAVITVVAFTSSGFGSNGKNALTAFAETPGIEEEEAGKSVEISTQAEVQIELTQAKEQGQRLAGSLLEKEIQQKQVLEIQSKELVAQINHQIAAEEKARKIAEEKARLAEEAARALEEAKRREEEEQAKRARSVSEEDYRVLLRIVQAEAGICDEKGKILVANVILNRVRDEEFPDTVRGVVYEPSQFSPVSNGRINSVKVTDETVQCVKRALAGEDYSKGALYFMNRRGSRGGAIHWFDSELTYLFRHGGHEFFK